jgi:hypothetical protein
VPVAPLEAGRVTDGEVDVLDAQRRVLLRESVDMRGEAALEGGWRWRHGTIVAAATCIRK